jgi:hypothetical protein
MGQKNLTLTLAILGLVSLSPGAFAKTAKECTAEWRADKAGMQAHGITEKAYVEGCRTGTPPVPAQPESKPMAAPSQPSTPSSAPIQTPGSSAKTAKECLSEWRADKAGMQARGITEKAYVEQCRAGGTLPTATAQEPRTSPAPAPKQATPAPPPAEPAPAPQRPSPTTTTAAPTSPIPPPSSPRSRTESLEAGQFADEAAAKASCRTDTVVWVNIPSKIYHYARTRSYGTTKRGAYMCEKQAVAAENRASKTEKHP